MITIKTSITCRKLAQITLLFQHTSIKLISIFQKRLISKAFSIISFELCKLHADIRNDDMEIASHLQLISQISRFYLHRNYNNGVRKQSNYRHASIQCTTLENALSCICTSPLSEFMRGDKQTTNFQ